MADISTIEKTVYDWVDSQGLVASDSIVWMDQNFAKKPNPMIGLKINPGVQIGEAYIGPPDVSGDAEIQINMDFTVSVQYFGEGSMEKILTLRDSLNKPSVRQSLRDGDVIVVNRLDAIDLSALDNSEFESRASMDILMRTDRSSQTDQVGVIETVNATGTYKSPGKPDVISNISVEST